LPANDPLPIYLNSHQNGYQNSHVLATQPVSSSRDVLPAGDRGSLFFRHDGYEMWTLVRSSGSVYTLGRHNRSASQRSQHDDCWPLHPSITNSSLHKLNPGLSITTPTTRVIHMFIHEARRTTILSQEKVILPSACRLPNAITRHSSLLRHLLHAVCISVITAMS
jgi:hypothetical protein